jgi:hypothetical protein
MVMTKGALDDYERRLMAGARTLPLKIRDEVVGEAHVIQILKEPPKGPALEVSIDSDLADLLPAHSDITGFSIRGMGPK